MNGATSARRREAGPSRFSPRRADRRGFTLVEMVVVVAIVMLLAAMLFPVFEAGLGKAEGASCVSNLHHLGMAARLYSDDYDEQIVPARLPGTGLTTICWDVSLQPYLRNRLVLLCPTDETPRRLANSLCELHSYGINLELAEVGGYLGSALRLGDVADPADCVLFCELDGQRYAVHGVSHDLDGLRRVAVRRHGSGANYAFVDGHTKWLLPERTEQPANLWYP